MKPLPFLQMDIPFPVNLHRLWDENIRAYGLFFSIVELHYISRSSALSLEDLQTHTQIEDLEELLKVLARFKLVIIDGSIIECPLASEGVERALNKRIYDRVRKSDKKPNRKTLPVEDEEED